MGAAVISAAPPTVQIQISADASSLDLSSANHTVTVRQASTPVRITVMDAAPGTPHRIEVYACVETDDAMHAPGRAAALTAASLRIRNAQGVWTTPQPLAELEGRRGVRVATLSGSAEILLQVQLEIPTRQAPGTYQGALTLLALER